MKHVGMDVHSTTTDVSVVDDRGKEVLYRQVKSTKEELVGLIKNIRGSKRATVEECQMADWVARAVTPHAPCDAVGAGNGATVSTNRARNGKPWIQTSAHLRVTAPVPEPTRSAFRPESPKELNLTQICEMFIDFGDLCSVQQSSPFGRPGR